MTSSLAESTRLGAAAPPYTAHKPRSLYFPTLDGLRFFAFALVFVHHLPNSTRFFLLSLKRNGWVGVSIFLTLSAYLLTAILASEYEQEGRISALRCYMRCSL